LVGFELPAEGQESESMTTDLDPKTESIRLTGYPATLIIELDEGEYICGYPGCEFDATTQMGMILHVKGEHPKDEIMCLKCMEKSKLEGKDFCDDCLEEQESVVVEEPPAPQPEPVQDNKINEEEIMPKKEDEKKESKCKYCGKPVKAGATSCGKGDCKKKYMREQYYIRKGRKPPEEFGKPAAKLKMQKPQAAKRVEASTGKLYEVESEVEEQPLMDGGKVVLTKVGGKVTSIEIVRE
jgi:hypothetical protein